MSALLDRLRERPNPFDNLVRPANAPVGFGELHVPEIHQAERERLLRIVDGYRLRKYATIDDLQPTRAVVVVGPRGAGKTHLLESLVYRGDGQPQIVAQRLSRRACSRSRCRFLW